MAKLEDVFGIRAGPVLSYVERAAVDDAFKAALRTDDHIVVYGSSKQGKTSLRLRNVKESNCIVVRCEPTMTLESIYSSIVRQLGVKIESVQTSTSTLEGTVKTDIGFKASIPLLCEGEAAGGAEFSTQRSLDIQSDFVAFNFSEAQSISELLVRFKLNKFIVLENFHYLKEEVQQQLSFGLKTFHEVRVRFIVLGIWREANLLMTYNGDLQDRIKEIPVEPWTEDDFGRVIEKGCGELNIRISPNISKQLMDNAYGNIGMLQEFLRSFCRHSGVLETDSGRLLDSQDIVKVSVQEKLEDQRAQLLKILQGIASKCRIRRGEDPLLLPYYLCKVLLRTSVKELQAGLERGRLLELLRNVHHRTDKATIRVGDVTNLLRSLPALQKDFSPPFLYYDANSRRLKVVDIRQFFVLANINTDELDEEISPPQLPTGADDNNGICE